MFQFFRKSKGKTNMTNELAALCDGTLIPLLEVNDPVFSQKMMGDGFAIKTTGDTFYAIHDAQITVLFPTKHAFALTLSDGLEVLIHIGIDTVNEKGNGFTAHVHLHDNVKAGDKIITIDRAYLETKGYDLTTMIVFTNADQYQQFSCNYGKKVIGGKDIAAVYEGVK